MASPHDFINQLIEQFRSGDTELFHKIEKQLSSSTRSAARSSTMSPSKMLSVRPIFMIAVSCGSSKEPPILIVTKAQISEVA